MAHDLPQPFTLPLHYLGKSEDGQKWRISDGNPPQVIHARPPKLVIKMPEDDVP